MNTSHCIPTFFKGQRPRLAARALERRLPRRVPLYVNPESSW
jgi:hypothetical protein